MQRLRRLPISVPAGATFALSFVVVLVVLRGWPTGGGPAAAQRDGPESGGCRAPARRRDERARARGLAGRRREVHGGRHRGAGRRRPGGGLLRRRPAGQALLSADQLVEVRDRGALFLDVADDDGSEFRALAVPREDDGKDDVLVALTELDPVEDAQEGLLRLALVGAPRRPARRCGGVAGGPTGSTAHPPDDRPGGSDQPEGALPAARRAAHARRGRRPGCHAQRPARPHRGGPAAGTGVHRRRQPRAAHPPGHPPAELELARSSANGGRIDSALDSALEEADRLGHLVDDLLLLARADAGYVSPPPWSTSARRSTDSCPASARWPSAAGSG